MAPASQAQSEYAGPRLIAGRYAVERTIGHGGMGRVYRVLDTSSGRRLALKLLHKDASERSAALFDREYRTLAGLRHPCIVQVFDYGRDEAGAYYTMELLEGRDLSGRAPLPWRTACAYLRDAASILGLLHARRLLHRDLSPRNLIEHADGRLKLIDFGALADFGPAAEVAGTPPYVPPEALGSGPLDQRSDLFELGALGYWLITDSNAFPARDLTDLPQLWKREPAPPSSLVSARGDPALGTPPPELDELVLQLLRTDPAERIASTAELIDRLNVIADLPPEAADDAVKGYLRSSVFVGRERELSELRGALEDARAGHGRAMLVECGAGAGRSRLLSELTLVARVAGALTLTNGIGVGRRPYALAESLLEQLQQSLPAELLPLLTSRARELAPLFPVRGVGREHASSPTPRSESGARACKRPCSSCSRRCAGRASWSC